MSIYLEDDLLLLSGIQHMAFCERQWALIHMNRYGRRMCVPWKENIFMKERMIPSKMKQERYQDREGNAYCIV